MQQSLKNDKEINVIKDYERDSCKMLDNFIKSLNHNIFKSSKDLDLESLRNFLILLLKRYYDCSLPYLSLINICEEVETYLHITYGSEFPDTAYPTFSNNDPRSIGMETLDYIHGLLEEFIIFPEDVPFFIEFLETPLGKEENAYLNLKNYTSRLDYAESLSRAKQEGIIS